MKELRSKHIQQDPLRFRRNIERVGEICAYEMSKSFSYHAESVVTPLAETEVSTPDEQIVLATILRAGQIGRAHV